MSYLCNSDVGTVTGQSFTGRVWDDVATSLPDASKDIRFEAGAQGKFVNCTFNGVVLFGDCSKMYWDSDGTIYTPPPDFDGLEFDNCTFNGSVGGAAQNLYVHDCTATDVIAHIWLSGLWMLTGRNNLIEDCDFSADSDGYLTGWVADYKGQRSPVMAKMGARGTSWSSVGNVFRRCTFSGWSEEGLGYDAPRPTVSTTIVSIDGNEVTLASTGTNTQIGRHLVVNEGAQKGSYYEITAHTGSVVTVDTSTFSLEGVESGEIANIEQALVETIWEDCELHCNGRLHQILGIGINVGVSLWGMSHGNIVRNNDFYFDGLASIGATAIHDQSVEFDIGGVITRSYNSHNKHYGNTIYDQRVDPTIGGNGVLIGTVQFSDQAETPESIFLSDGLGGVGTEVYDNDMGDTLCGALDVDGLTWYNNTNVGSFTTAYDGYTPYDFVTTTLYLDQYVPTDPETVYYDSEWFPVWSDAYLRPYVYALPIGEESRTTFELTDLFPSKYDLAISVSPIVASGEIDAESSLDGIVNITTPISGDSVSEPLVDGEASVVILVSGDVESDSTAEGAVELSMEGAIYDLALEVLPATTFSSSGEMSISVARDGISVNIITGYNVNVMYGYEVDAEITKMEVSPQW